MDSLFDYSESAEVAESATVLPASWDEAFAMANKELPGETYTVRDNYAAALMRRAGLL